MATQDESAPEGIPGAIAIIGMAGRWPGANTPSEFWRNLCAGVESITRFQDSDLEDSFSAEIRGAANFVKARPILEHVDRFDAEFFGMYAKEAELTDPQHRLFLECSWEALEDAGYDPAQYRGSIGVFAGSSINTYLLHNVCGDRRTIEEFTSSYQVGCYPLLLGAGQDFLATRVSYKLDLRGPSLTVQTACSTSLLAVAQACQSLQLYQADMALAGGVSITFPQKRGYQHLEGGMVSADGTCRPFDAEATGTIFGSGAGVVLLKRLEDAVADGDHIYAIVRGSGINNDGATKVGFTAPSVDGQAAVIEMAHAGAGVDPGSISYVECHGTATPLGDPIEIAGLTKAFAAAAVAGQFCAIGSVKGNVGHLDAAAGVTGLIKTALALENRLLPPSLHYRRPNPQIDFSRTPFFVNASLTPWPDTASPRRAGVSAFGVGGTNVHLILEQAPAAPTPTVSTQPQLIVLSARSGTALDAARQRLAAYLRDPAAREFADVAYSLQVGRRAFRHRLAIVARDPAQAVAKLETGAADREAPGAGAHVVFMFPGQGAQYPDMGRDLFEHEPVFRQAIERCAAVLQPLMTDDLLTLLYPAENSADAKQRLMSTIAAQPAIFSVEFALAQLWMSWGIKPSAMIGHSIGEFVAAVIAGVMSLEDALGVVADRGRLMQSLPGGAMLAVRLPESEITPLLPPSLNLAAVNGPALCVVAGPFEAVAAFEQSLTSRSVATRRLHTSHAFHSSMVDPVIEPLRRRLAEVHFSAPLIPYVSCVTGQWITPDQAMSPEYWARHAREPVRFADGIATLSQDITMLIEVGPGNALSSLAAQATRGRSIPVLTSMQDANRERGDRDCLLEALGRAWTLGASPDWRALHESGRVRVPLPTYPFERSRHWIDAPAVAAPVISTLTTTATTATSQPSISQDGSAMTQVNDHVSRVGTKIAAIFEELSGERPAANDAQTTFLEMGYDSLFLTQVAQKIQSQMKVKITFRQLLGELSTIPALAAFLADKMPNTVAGAPTTPDAITAPAAAIAPTGIPTGLSASPSATPSAMADLFRDQLQAMSQLINRQFEMLQGAPGVAPAAPPTPTAPSTTASEAPAQPSRFQVFVPGKAADSHSMTSAQRRHIDELIEHYTAKTAGSKRFTQSHRAVLADPRAAAGFRSEWKEIVYPIVNSTSAGSKITDIDGNEYIDLVNGYGKPRSGTPPVSWSKRSRPNSNAALRSARKPTWRAK